jgi:hypothetical protein
LTRVTERLAGIALPSGGGGVVMPADGCGNRRLDERRAGLLADGGPNFGVTGEQRTLAVCWRSESVCWQARGRLASKGWAGRRAGSKHGAASSWSGMEAIGSRRGDGAGLGAKTPLRSNCIQTGHLGLNYWLANSLVGVTGIEPATPASKTSGPLQHPKYFHAITATPDNSGSAILGAFCTFSCKLRSNLRGALVCIATGAHWSRRARKAAPACLGRSPARLRQPGERT